MGAALPFAATAQGLRLAAAAEAVGDALPPGIDLFLEVSLNGVATGQLGRFVLRDKALWAAAQTLRDLGLRLPASLQAQEAVALATLPALQVDYDGPRQRIALVAPVEMLDRAPTELQAQARARLSLDAPLPSVLLSYDAYAQRFRQGAMDGHSLSAWTDLRLSGVGPGVWSTSTVARMAAASNSPALRELVRMDTQWLREDPDTLTALAVGDVVSGSLGWTRATRIGGVRFGRDFGLQPYLSTAPSTLVRGQAVLPSTVDLYINGLRQMSRQVQPGEFIVEGAPLLNGVGQARLVVTDVNGQQRTVELPLYGTPRLLRAGLLDGSVAVGAVREDYGLRSFSYAARPLATGSVRYGWSDALTLEAHAEADAGGAMTGAGAAWLLPGSLGVVNAAAAVSAFEGARGGQLHLGYQWSGPAWSVSLASQRAGADFRDVAGGHGVPLPSVVDQAFLGTSTPWGSLGLGYVMQAIRGQPRARLANASWSLPLPGAASISLALMHDVSGGATTLGLSFFMPLEQRVSTSAGLRRSGGTTVATAGAARNATLGRPEWGWRVDAAAGTTPGAWGQVTREGPHGQWSAGGSYQRSTIGSPATTLHAAATGALLRVGGSTHAVRRVDQAFALVSTDGVADIEVELENVPVGRTDANGLLVVHGLRAHERNKLAISPLTLRLDMQLASTQRDAVPPGRSGVAVRFPMRQVVAVRLNLHDAAGQPVPLGTRVWLEADGAPARALVVGYDALVYLEDPPPGARLRNGAGPQACVASLPPLDGRGMVDLGVLRCQRPS